MQERNRGAKCDIFADIWHCNIFTAVSVVAAGAVVVAAGVVGVGCGATGLINCVCEITEIRNNLAAARPWGSIISNTTVSSLDNTPQHTAPSSLASVQPWASGLAIYFQYVASFGLAIR